jgi:4-hydroxybenzoate polyprenyltransferase
LKDLVGRALLSSQVFKPKRCAFFELLPPFHSIREPIAPVLAPLALMSLPKPIPEAEQVSGAFKIPLLFALSRPHNIGLMLLLEALTYFYLTTQKGIDAHFSPFQTLLLLFAITFLVAAAGYWLNDWQDQNIDAQNRPDRFLKVQKVGVKTLLSAAWLCNVAALLLAFWLNLSSFLLVLGLETTLFFYARKGKKMTWISNLLIAICSAAPLFLVALNFKVHCFFWLGLYAYFAFMVSFLREIVKDVEDIAGDLIENCQTLPLKYGEGFTKKTLLALFVFLDFSLASLAFWFKITLLYVLALLIIFASMGFIQRIIKAKKEKDYQKISFYLKMLMLLGTCFLFFI